MNEKQDETQVAQTEQELTENTLTPQQVGKINYALLQMKETTRRIRSNDIIAMLLLTGIIVLWIVQGLGGIELPEVILGATIAGWTIIIQYYFRKARGEHH